MPNSVAYLKSARLGGDGRTLVCVFDYPFANEIQSLGDTAVPKLAAKAVVKTRPYQGSGDDETVALELTSIESKVYPGKDFGRWTATFKLMRKAGLSRFDWARIDYNEYGLFIDNVGAVVTAPIDEFQIDNTGAL